MLTFYRLLLWPDLGHEVAPNLIPGGWVIKRRSEKDLKQVGLLPWANYQATLRSVCMLSCIPLFAASWTVAHQAPLSMGFFRQGSWSGLLFPSLGDPPKPGIEPGSPKLQADSLPLSHLASPYSIYSHYKTLSIFSVVQCIPASYFIPNRLHLLTPSPGPLPTDDR